jgi:hypothetical protein
MRISACCLLSIMMMASTSDARRLGAQDPETRAQQDTPRDTATYSSQASDFVVGKRVYLHSTKTFIGTITAVDPNKSFPRTFARSHMKAVLIARVGGSKDWVPVDGITRIYVTR